MKFMMKASAGAVALALLAACGGGDGDGGSSGGGGDAKLSQEQVVWLGHESAFIGTGIPMIARSLADAALSFLDEESPAAQKNCDPLNGETGTVSRTFADVDEDGLLSDGDKVELNFEACYDSDEDISLNGPVTVTFGGLTGDIFDSSVDSTAKISLLINSLGLDQTETLNGTIELDYSYDTKGTLGRDDDVESLAVTSDKIAITSQEDSKTYSVDITNYSSAATWGYDHLLYSLIKYGVAGTDALLGSFNYQVSTSAPVTEQDDGTITDGEFKAVGSGETITTLFITASGGETTVKISSTSGVTATMDYAEFDNL